MNELGVKATDIKNVYLAGGFGNYMNKKSAVMIGLIPKELDGKIVSVGNSAGVGAVMALTSVEKYKESISVSKDTNYIELSGNLDFQNNYVDAMYFEI